MVMQTNIVRAFLLAAFALTIAVCEAAKAGTMEIVGNSGVSGQMMFLQSNGQVAILDKVENNPTKDPNGKGGPAWAVFYNYNTNTFQPTHIRSNTFCAGGGMLGDGRWVVLGGNKAVGTGGLTDKANTNPYYDYDGGKALRFLSPCSGSSCQWSDSSSNKMLKERWYSYVEPMQDGHVMMLGGMRDGGFVPSASSNEPTYEFYPSTGSVYSMDLLSRSVPLSLYPITYLMSDSRVFVQANLQAILWNTTTQKETKLSNIPAAPRVYPASGGNAMLPMVPSNNYQQTILFCGGMSLGSAAGWGNEAGPAVSVTERPASTNCAQITPLVSSAWTNVDPLPEGRSMGNFVILPDGTLWFGNGVKTGVAGYTTDPKSPGNPVGYSFGDNPSYKPLIYDPSKPAGSRWKQVATQNVGRLYHSTATLLPDGSILTAGSNPSPDVNMAQKWKTEYRVERFYPEYYDAVRPSNAGLPSSIGYGGAGFTLTMASAADAANTKVVIIRTGFSTHGMQMGQRSLQLQSSVSDATVKVAAMPPNAALFAPGTALAFVVVNGVPSMGKFITVGNGVIGTQPIQAATNLNRRDFDVHEDILLERGTTSTADAIASALEGPPTTLGISLSSSLSDIISSVNQTLQQQVTSVFDQFQNGTSTDHLSGRRRRRELDTQSHLYKSYVKRQDQA
ncbi:hypothetical protein CBS101457_006828 [Exobasidium rhododendri]|nr:hypothetical protein CBS101457_006828 [Exobasidium rhododendri]